MRLQPQRVRLDRATVIHCDCCPADQNEQLTIDGEAVVLGPGGLSLFDELRRRFAFDLIGDDGEDLRDRPFLEPALAWLRRDTETGVLLNEHNAEDWPTVFAHACRHGAEGIVS